jgi:hypothetical protein
MWQSMQALISRISRLLPAQDREAENLLEHVPHVDGSGRRATFNDDVFPAAFEWV